MAKEYKKRKDGRYEGKIAIGYKDNGRLNRITVYGKTIRELQKKMNDIKYEHEHGILTDDRGITLEAYAVKWCDTYKINKASNTKAMYDNIIEKHINYEIGHKLIKDITKSDIQKLINSRADQYRTCEQIKLTLKQIFDCAIEDGIVYRNPCKGIELPKKPHNEKRILTDVEKKAIKTAEFSPKEKAFVYLIYGCGLRRGEALALTKGDIDLKRGILTVNKAIAFTGNDPEQKEPKSYSGFRQIDIPDFVTEYLTDYLKCVDIILFPMANGGLMTQSSYRKMWQQITKKIQAAAGLYDPFYSSDGLTAHIFRHNYCTMLYYSGMTLKKATQLMGHSDTKMIMDVYAHLDDQKERAKDKINKTIAL